MLPSSAGGKEGRPSSHRSSPATAAPGNESSIVVTDLNPNDILLGRGAPIINYQGNVRFRELVSTRKAEYIGTGRHQVKDGIARQIVEEIERRNGRFLRRIESLVEVQKLGVSEGKKAWRIAEDDVAIEKVKQALRDKEPIKPQVDAASGGHTANDANLVALEYGRQSSSSGSSIQALSDNMRWLRGGAPSFPDHQRTLTVSAPATNRVALTILLHQEEYNRQQHTLLNHQHCLEQQHLGQLRRQQQMRSNPLSRFASSLRFGVPNSTDEYLSALSRRGAAAVAPPPPNPRLRGLTDGDLLALDRQNSSVAAMNLLQRSSRLRTDQAALQAMERVCVSHLLSERDRFASRRHDADMSAANLQAGRSQAYVFAMKQSRSAEEIQRAALAALREQRQIDLHRELVLRSSNLLGVGLASQHNSSPAFRQSQGPPAQKVVSLAVARKLVPTLQPPTFHFAGASRPPCNVGVAKVPSPPEEPSPPSVSKAVSTLLRAPSSGSGDDRKRNDTEDIPEDATAALASSKIEFRAGREPQCVSERKRKRTIG